VSVLEVVVLLSRSLLCTISLGPKWWNEYSSKEIGECDQCGIVAKLILLLNQFCGEIREFGILFLAEINSIVVLLMLVDPPVSMISLLLRLVLHDTIKFFKINVFLLDLLRFFPIKIYFWKI
jgi:hypothetical protein